MIKLCICHQHETREFSNREVAVLVAFYVLASGVIGVALGLKGALIYIGICLSVWAVGSLARWVIWGHSPICALRGTTLYLLDLIGSAF